MFNIFVDFNDYKTVLKNHGLDENGVIQKQFTNEVHKLSDPYVPYQNGVLKNNSHIGNDYIIYDSAHARYHWYGKLMVGSAPKELTNIDMSYNGSPTRGPKWVERMWANSSDEIISNLQNMVDRGVK